MRSESATAADFVFDPAGAGRLKLFAAQVDGDRAGFTIAYERGGVRGKILGRIVEGKVELKE
jgi:hypothetical protein